MRVKLEKMTKASLGEKDILVTSQRHKWWWWTVELPIQ